jgi:hypothetical protein
MLGTLTPNRNVFQIYISDDHAMPAAVEQCTRSVAGHCGGYQHSILDSGTLRSFLEKDFPHEVVWAYDTLVPYAYKADLGRYCLLYKHGGWYMDITVTLDNQLPELDGIESVVFKDAPWPNQHVWDTSTSVIFANAGNGVMELAIRMIVENCRSSHYGSCPLDPTGPGVLGRALAISGPDNKRVTGMYLPLTPAHQQKNFAFVLPNGHILGWGKGTHGTPAGQGLASYGATGTNDYTALYAKGMIYRKS